MGRKLSSIEMMVLGLTWQHGPCSTYAIMKMLSYSGSSYYKSRAGTAYSVTKRLLEGGLLEATDNPKAGGEHHVGVSAAGIEALREWISPPIPPQDIAHSADLIRLRFFFIGVLEPEARLTFIDESLTGLYEFLETVEGYAQENEDIGNYFATLATLSTVLETRARITWLKTVREWVKNPPTEGESWTKMVLNGLPPI